MSARSASRWRSTLAALGLLAGTAAILRLSLWAFGGWEHLFDYSTETAHKMTSRAILGGSLRLHRELLGTGHDEQVFRGAAFTNWGFGVPLIEAPFHAIAPLFKALGTRYFPDRAIFFLHLVVLAPVLWIAVRRGLVARGRGAGAWLFAWTATLGMLAYGLYELMAYRFIVYEITIAYFVVYELFAIAFWLRWLDTRAAGWACACAAAASMALVIRPTGAIYLLAWFAIFVCEAERGRRLRAAIAFALAGAPLTMFWLASNWVRSGSPFSTGHQNGLPGFAFHYPMLRFGSTCASTLKTAWDCAVALFTWFFVKVEDPQGDVARCHFINETRFGGDPTPFFPPIVLLVLLGGAAWLAARHVKRVSAYVPVAAFAAMFVVFVRFGMGFGYRYSGDFWPAIFLAAIAVAREVRLGERPTMRGVAAALVAFETGALCVQSIAPSLHTIETMSAPMMAAADAEWTRSQTTEQPPVAPRWACGDTFPSWLRSDGNGMGGRCELTATTNLYLGVPEKDGDRYQLRFATDHPLAPSLRVYVNGKIVEAHLGSDGAYAADVALDRRRFYSPVVMITIEWTRDWAQIPGARLLSIELA